MGRLGEHVEHDVLVVPAGRHDPLSLLLRKGAVVVEAVVGGAADRVASPQLVLPRYGHYPVLK